MNANEISMEHTISIPCLRVKQPIGGFYIGSIKSADLCEITKTDTRRLAGEKGFETYLGIQRPLLEKRVRDIAQYVKTEDACFPTGIILAVSGKCAEFNEQQNTLTLKPYLNPGDGELKIEYEEIANVLDGQHRIEGLKRAAIGSDFDINVSIFVDIDIADQAYIFSTVNLAQTKVNKSLVYDLFDLAKKRSPQKSCHNIAVALDRNESSPFFTRIKRLGVATEGRFNETITQATFVESLLRYVSKDPVHDRNEYLKGRKPKLVGADELKVLIFRNMFIEERDLELTDIIWNYFDAIRGRWTEAWNNMGHGSMLNKTNGFRALMRFLKPSYLKITSPGNVPTREQFMAVFAEIEMNDADFNTNVYKPGTSGESKLYHVLLEKSGMA